MSDLNAFPQFPDCSFCNDTGLIYLDGYKPPYRWCTCPAGSARQQKEPALVTESNRQAERLGIGAAK